MTRLSAVVRVTSLRLCEAVVLVGGRIADCEHWWTEGRFVCAQSPDPLVVTFVTSKSRRLTLSRSQMASARKLGAGENWELGVYPRGGPYRQKRQTWSE